MTLSPDAADAMFDEIVAAVGRGDRAMATRTAVAALRLGLDEPLVLMLAAEDAQANGLGQQAIALMQQAAEAAPEEPEPWLGLGSLLSRHGREHEALSALQTALECNPALAPALRLAASLAFRLGRLTFAEDCYRRLLAQTPEDSEALAALAALAARRGRGEEARGLALRALAVQPGLVAAHLALARADLLDGLPDPARARMDEVLSQPTLATDARIAVHDLRAEAHDAAGRATEAFADYAARNDQLRRQHEARLLAPGTERRVDQARRLARSFAAMPPATWSRPAEGPPPGPSAPGHVFLLGFPRSGTTLLEKALAAHPAVITLEEVDHLGTVAQGWLANDNGWAHLAAFAPAPAEQARRAYWRAVSETTGSDLSGRTVVDKLPLHTLALPVIARLFPAARILFALRDPRDVVLSCFRRRFQINGAMFEFLDLADAARYYDAVMSLAMLYRAGLPLHLQEVRHEALVADFESELRRVLHFCGLPWSPAVMRFTDALKSDPRTPSDMQLRGGLTTEGIGQWRRYAAQLAPVEPTLAPWVARYGYGET